MLNRFLKGEQQIKTRGAVVLFAIGFFIAFGTLSFHALEKDWTWIQSFYFTIVTLTTVGYGDLHPSTDSSRLFTAIFILLGVTIVVSSISFVGSGYLQRRTEHRETKLAKKHGKRD